MKQDSIEKKFLEEVVYPHNRNPRNKAVIDGKGVLVSGFDIKMVNKVLAFIKQEIKRVIGKDEEDSLSEVRGELTKDARHFILDNTNYIRNQLRASQRKKGSLG